MLKRELLQKRMGRAKLNLNLKLSYNSCRPVFSQFFHELSPTRAIASDGLVALKNVIFRTSDSSLLLAGLGVF